MWFAYLKKPQFTDDIWINLVRAKAIGLVEIGSRLEVTIFSEACLCKCAGSKLAAWFASLGSGVKFSYQSARTALRKLVEYVLQLRFFASFILRMFISKG